MPRAKKPRPQPNETFTIQVNGEEVVCEVWENSADEGTRGAHMRRKRDLVFDAVLENCELILAGESNIRISHLQRLIFGPETLTAFGKFVMQTAKVKKITIGQTLAEEIAQSIRHHYQAIKAALAQKNSDTKNSALR